MKININERIVTVLFAMAALFTCVALAGLPERAEAPYKIGMKILHEVPLKWETLADGFERTVLIFEGEGSAYDGSVVKRFKRRVEFAVYRVDAGKYPVRIVTANAVAGSKMAALKDIHEKTGALLTVNGGFFSLEDKPTGLVVSGGKVVSPYNEEGGSGALAVYGGAPMIGWAAKIAESEPMPEYALQNGPLLVDPGRKFGINVIAAHYFYRTAVGIDGAGRLLIGVTRKKHLYDDIEEGLNLYEAAAIFYHTEKEGGLNAHAALNLDGGTSTGLLLTMGEHKEDVYISADVPNFVCVMPPR